MHLQVEALWEECFTDEEISLALESLPRDLNETYRRCLQRICKKPLNPRRFAKRALRWVACASRSLNLGELREAVAFDLQDQCWDPTRIPSSSSVINCCANLLIVDTTDRYVRLVHSSLYSLLCGNLSDDTFDFVIDPLQGRIQCGEQCVNYLSFSDFSLQIQPRSSLAKALADIPHPMAIARYSLGEMASRFSSIRLRGSAPGLPTVHVAIPWKKPPTRHAEVREFEFLQYARSNWTNDTKQITQHSPVWNKFKALALQPNVTWNLHPWNSSGQSLLSHFHGLLGYAVQIEHLPLFNLLLDPDAVQASGGNHHFSQYCNIPLNNTAGGLSALHVASRMGNLELVSRLLAYSQLNLQDEYGNTALHYVCEKGHLEVAKTILAWKGTKVNTYNKEGATPIWLAAFSGHADMLSLLIQKGATVRTKNKSGHTIANVAIMHGDVNIIQVLLSAEELKKDFSTYFGHVLTEAVQSNQWEIIVLLCRNGLITGVSLPSCHTLLIAASKFGHADAVTALRDSGARVNAVGDDGQTPLHLAVSLGHRNLVRSLLSRGVEPDIRNTDGLAPLHLLSGKCVLLASDFLDAGADLEVKDEDGNTPLHHAAAKELAEEVQSLIALGCDMDSSSSWEFRSRLRLPSLRKLDVEIWKEVFDGIYIERIFLSKLTPLHFAAANGHVSVVERLVQSGASSSPEPGLFSPLHLAVLCVNTSVAQHLIDLGADVNSRVTAGPTPLHLAVMRGAVQLAAKLVSAGATLDVKMRYRGNFWTALELASSKQNVSIEATIIKEEALRNVNVGCDASLSDWTTDPSPVSGFETTLNEPAPLSLRRDLERRTLLFYTFLSGNLRAMEWLLKNGADVNARDNRGDVPLSYAIITCEDEEAALVLLENGADPNVPYHTNDTMFRLAVLFDRRRVAKALWVRGAGYFQNQAPFDRQLPAYKYESHLWWQMMKEALKYSIYWRARAASWD